MDILKQWFEEAQNRTKTFVGNKCTFIIYKGFKITEKQGSYSLQDVRFRDVYSKVSKKDRKVIENFGFIRGIDLITYTRDLKRVRQYHRRIEQLYTYRGKLKADDPKYDSKLSLCNENINKSSGLVFYYQTRVNQFKFKYNGKDKEIEIFSSNIERSQKV